MDVISIYQAGFHNVVATLGTALTEEQARLIAQYAEQVIISYDSDVAGQRASERAITLLSQAGVATRVLAMEGAKDPDEYIKKFGATRFKLLLEGANNPMEFELLKIKQTLDLSTDDGKLTYLRHGVGRRWQSSKTRWNGRFMPAKLAEETGVSKAAILDQVGGVMKRSSGRPKNGNGMKFRAAGHCIRTASIRSGPPISKRRWRRRIRLPAAQSGCGGAGGSAAFAGLFCH